MEMKGFTEKLERAMQRCIREDESIRFSRAEKNNGICLTGVSVPRTGCGVTPTVYLEEYMQRYESGETLSRIVNEILTLCRGGADRLQFDIEEFGDYRYARERIALRLINTEKNRELLVNVPGIPFLDLTMVFYYLLGGSTPARASILIRKEHMERWGVRLAELYEAARRNMPRLLPVRVMDMETLMREILCGQLEENSLPREECERLTEQLLLATTEERELPEMYVLTNREKYFGAAGMTDAKAMAGIARQLDSDLYVLPSSVHEVILLPVSPELCPQQLGAMVRDVNATQVAPEEVLSDAVYRYERERAAFRIVHPAELAQSA